MARPKHGLGQGLEALVGPHLSSGAWPLREPVNADPGDPEPAATITRWEFAVIEDGRAKGKGSKRQITVVLSCAGLRVKPRRQRIRAVGLWTALGLMGVDGWELVGVRKRCFYFKRPASA